MLLRKDADGQQYNEAHFRISNRNLPEKDGCDVHSLAHRVVEFFELPHQELVMSAEAKSIFTGLQACYNARGATLRGSSSAAASREGTGPWQVAMLAAASAVWEIACGEKFDLVVEKHHVLRAHMQVQMSHRLQDIWCEHGKGSAVAAPNMSASEKLAAACKAGRLPSSQFALFEPSQTDVKTEASDSGDAEQGVLELSDDAVPALQVGYGLDGASVQDPELGEIIFADRVPNLSKKTQLFSPKNMVRSGVRCFDVKQLFVQNSFKSCWKNTQPQYDTKIWVALSPTQKKPKLLCEEIMLKTLLRGESCIYGKSVIDSVCIKSKCPATQKVTRKSLKLPHWKAVMSAGLAQHRVGYFSEGTEEADRPGWPRVVLELPDPSNESATKEYHNRLMRLCGLPFHALSQKIRERAMRRPPKGKQAKKGTEVKDEIEDAAEEEVAAASSEQRGRKRLRPAADLGFGDC